jgi:hypothetical protein
MIPTFVGYRAVRYILLEYCFGSACWDEELVRFSGPT